MDKKEMNKFVGVPLVIEEKIDGANLGISINKGSKSFKIYQSYFICFLLLELTMKDYEMIFQNRSKVISSASDAQWKNLDSWVKQTPGLWEVKKLFY